MSSIRAAPEGSIFHFALPGFKSKIIFAPLSVKYGAHYSKLVSTAHTIFIV